MKSTHERSAVEPLARFARLHSAPSARAAMKLAVRQMLSEAGSRQTPVELKPLCERLGVKVYRKQRMRGEASLIVHDGRFQIWIDDSSKSWRRNRFTIAHELSHVLLLKSISGFADLSKLHTDGEAQMQLEQLCDYGAAELLAPSGIVKDLVIQHGLTHKAIQKLYDTLLISYEAVTSRIADVFPNAAVILWREHARHEHESVSLRVLRSYPFYKNRPHSPWLPKGCTLKHLFPDIITKALRTRTSSYSDRITVKLSHIEHRCLGAATVIPSTKREASQLPLFNGMSVPDQEDFYADAMLLVTPRCMTNNSEAWDSIRRECDVSV